MAGDPYWNQVVLAMHMDGANASTVFTDLKGHTMTAAGTAQISTAQSKFGGASSVFGTSTANKVTSAASADFAVGGSPFTIEFWVYATAYNASGGRIVSAGGGAAAYNSTTGIHWSMETTATGAWFPFWDGAGQSYLVLNLSLNVWTHLAVTYDGTTIRSFTNGVLIASAGVTFISPSTTPSLGVNCILGDAVGAANTFSGYIDDLRITKGVCRYTATFTPPAAAFPDAPAMISGTVQASDLSYLPRAVRVYRKSDGALSGAMTSSSTDGSFSVPALDASPHFAIAHDTDADPYWPYVVLATHFNTDSVVTAPFTDLTGKTITPNGTPSISTTTKKYGDGSLSISGANTSLTVPFSNDIEFGSSNFTVEYWINGTSPANKLHLSRRPVSSAVVSLITYFDASSRCAALLSTDGVSWDIALTGTTVVTGGAWNHFALVRKNGLFTLYVNGVTESRAALSTPTASLLAMTTGLGIGTDLDNATSFAGYIDDLRITKGVARYSDNFTPPERAFTTAMGADVHATLIYDDLTPV
jgi:hypothetical protein